MKLKLIRALKSRANKQELLLEVDDEFMEAYKSDTGDTHFNQESFDKWFSNLVEEALSEDDWKNKEGDFWDKYDDTSENGGV